MTIFCRNGCRTASRREPATLPLAGPKSRKSRRGRLAPLEFRSHFPGDHGGVSDPDRHHAAHRDGQPSVEAMHEGGAEGRLSAIDAGASRVLPGAEGICSVGMAPETATP